jgi:hypothetical protein
MPLPVPPIDNRRYQDLVDEMLARVPVHTPEWTNFNDSDPGVTLIQLFAHITESMLYRANQIPERNRAKFLDLLGVKLNPAQGARGMISFSNINGPIEPTILQSGTELSAEKIAFRTINSLDVLPVEAAVFVKQKAELSDERKEYYNLLYASWGQDDIGEIDLYETIPILGGYNVELSNSIDSCIWLAILANPRKDLEAVRNSIAGRTLSLGIIPHFDPEQLILQPGGQQSTQQSRLIVDTHGEQIDQYIPVKQRSDFDPLTTGGIIELQLPPTLHHWTGFDPLEAGVGELPPIIEDKAIADRLVTWLRIRASAESATRLQWLGINAAEIQQRVVVNSERIGTGNGEPDQSFSLAKTPILAGTTNIVSALGDASQQWHEIDDILAAEPEVPILRKAVTRGDSNQYMVDAEAGVIKFGDGLTGKRPRINEILFASYAYCEGKEGNVAAFAIKGGATLPSGITATNPLPTSGGADAEQISNAEKQASRILQHRERLVTADDFRTITWRTPGVSIGRVEVLSAAHPEQRPITAGNAPGAVTLMVLPANDPNNPDAPRAAGDFLNAICHYLDPRRLVTTEIILRGADYVGIWISIGITVAGGYSIAATTEAIKERIQAWLSPLPPKGTQLGDRLGPLYGPGLDPSAQGWPLGKAVNAKSLLAETARVPGVVEIDGVLLSKDTPTPVELVSIQGLQLPEILGISVVEGAPISLNELQNPNSNSGNDSGNSGGGTPPKKRLPVPVLEETC